MLGRKRFQPPHRLTRHAERLTAGRQNTKIRTGPEQRHAEFRARVEDVLTVVEQQQHVPIGQVPAHRIRRHVPRRTANAEYPRRLSRDILRPAYRDKIDQPDAIGPLPRLPTTHLDRRPGLSDTSRADQRDQPGSPQHLPDALELRHTADQPGQGRGQEGTDPNGPS